MVELKGHGGSAVSWDGTVLTIRATNGPSRVALFGEDGSKGLDRVELTRAQIDGVRFKPGKSILTNGLLEVKADGRTMKVHFLRKHKDEFAAVARELGATVDD